MALRGCYAADLLYHIELNDKLETGLFTTYRFKFISQGVSAPCVQKNENQQPKGLAAHVVVKISEESGRFRREGIADFILEVIDHSCRPPQPRIPSKYEMLNQCWVYVGPVS